MEAAREFNVTQEVTENGVYKKLLEITLQKNADSFCPMRKEKQMDYLFAALQKDFVKKGQSVLDACCGYGRLLYFLEAFDSQQQYVGIDYVPALIEQGKQRFKNSTNISFVCDDLLSSVDHYQKAFDITINYKTLYCMPYYENLLKNLITMTKKKLYITSPFWDGDIDFITKIYQEASGEGPYTFLNTYSMPKFKRFCERLGVKEIKEQAMVIDVDLPEYSKGSQLSTYTTHTREGSRLEITGNIVLHWKLIELVLEET